MSDQNTKNVNARHLLEEVHKIRSLLTARTTSSMSPEVVPASEASAIEVNAHRRLKTVCGMLEPAAGGQDAWTTPVGEVVVPQLQEHAPTGASSVERSGEIVETTMELSLQDVARLAALTAATTKEGKGRCASSETVEEEGVLPLRFVEAAVRQVWHVLDAINLGVPRQSRGFADYGGWDE